VTQRPDARRPPTVPSLNLASVRYASSDENKPPPLARGSTPLQPKHPPALAAALAAAAARGLDSALLSSWGVQSDFVSATPTPPPKAFGASAEGGLSSRRLHLSGTGSTPSSSNAVLDLTQAAATPLHAAACSALLQAVPPADMDALAHLIGHSTHRSHHAGSRSNKKQRLQKGQSKRGHETDRSGAKTSSLLPQFTKGFSLYMKRWNPTYYFGQPVESPVPPTACNGTQKPQPQSPKLKPTIAAAAHQSWAAAAEAAKTKIAMIEEEHARRRATTEPKIMQVITASFSLERYECLGFITCFLFWLEWPRLWLAQPTHVQLTMRNRCSSWPKSKQARRWASVPRSASFCCVKQLTMRLSCFFAPKSCVLIFLS
jgi:hypothetical protein